MSQIIAPIIVVASGLVFLYVAEQLIRGERERRRRAKRRSP